MKFVTNDNFKRGINSQINNKEHPIKYEFFKQVSHTHLVKSYINWKGRVSGKIHDVTVRCFVDTKENNNGERLIELYHQHDLNLAAFYL